MRFGFVSPDYLSPAPSAIGRATALLVGELRRRGHSVVVWAEWTEGAPPAAQGGLEFRRLATGGGRGGEWLARWRLWRQLCAEQRRRPLDGLEVPDFQGWLPLPVPGLPVQVRLHHGTVVLRAARGVPVGRLMRRWEMQTLRRAAGTLVPSAEAQRRTEAAFGFAVRRPVRVPCPVAIPAMAAATAPEADACGGAAKFVYAGAFTRLKGADLFVAAAERAALPGELWLAFGEDGNDPVAVPAGSPVRRLGRVDGGAVAAGMAGATALLAPSRCEAQGLAVAEALAAGCPVITRRQPPATEFYPEDALFWVDGDDPDAWAAAVAAVRDRPAQARAAALRGRDAVAARFAPEVVATAWLESWHRLRPAAAGSGLGQEWERKEVAR